uniref:Peptidase C1A papain C-terminal domain-containing protein n=1 Tax=viral metagenome TaxID=1070528 RepID=A0A6C0BEP1_9ZZZZ
MLYQTLFLLSLFVIHSLSNFITWDEYLNKFPFIKVTNESKINFELNLKIIIESQFIKKSYELGVTPYMHLSDNEWSSRFYNFTFERKIDESLFDQTISDKKIPSSWDWRLYGVTTDVKDQGQVGTCWAQASTETVETAWAIKSKQLKVLSVQQLVDCCKLNNGIDGGLPDYSYKYLISTPQCLNDTYPYVSDVTHKNGVCHSCEGAVSKLSKYIDIKDNDEDLMLQAVLITSLAVGIKADDKQFQVYKSGVLDYNCDSNEKSIDHAVTIEGYGTENGKDYWLVRNSWGTSWGEDGYIKMARGKCLCGICHMVSYPVF